METFVFSNQKGGVGKSTIAVHKAIYHADQGLKVLFVDFDGQGNSTASLVNRSQVGPDAVAFFDNVGVELPAPVAGITLLPGTNDLNDVERFPDECITHPKAHLAKLESHYDCCIIDTPPTLGLRLIGALVAADYALCPFELSGYSIQGLAQMTKTIQGTTQNFNENLLFLGMIANRFNSRSSGQREAFKEILAHFGDLIIRPPIGIRVSIQEATDEGKAVWEVKSGAARTAAKEILAVLKEIDRLANKGKSK